VGRQRNGQLRACPGPRALKNRMCFSVESWLRAVEELRFRICPLPPFQSCLIEKATLANSLGDRSSGATGRRNGRVSTWKGRGAIRDRHFGVIEFLAPGKFKYLVNRFPFRCSCTVIGLMPFFQHPVIEICRIRSTDYLAISNIRGVFTGNALSRIGTQYFPSLSR